MAKHSPAAKQLVLGDRSGVGQVRVDIEAFFELSFWMAEELEDLAALWLQRLPARRERRVVSSPRILPSSHRPR